MSGQDGSGVAEVAPSVTVVFSTPAAVATAADAMTAKAATPSAKATLRPFRDEAVKARQEVLDIGTAPL
jgi:hypothetical protein